MMWAMSDIVVLFVCRLCWFLPGLKLEGLSCTYGNYMYGFDFDWNLSRYL